MTRPLPPAGSGEAATPASVLMQSARSRVTLVAGLIGLLWLAVMWALA